MHTEQPDPPIAELLGRISVRLRQKMSSAMDDFDLHGLTPHQARIVGYIEANEAKGLIQRDLTAITGTRAASVSSMLQALEADGWVERRPDPTDSRRKTVHVTAKARELVTRFESDMWASAEIPPDALTDTESAELRRLLTKLDRALAD
ncbi:MAG: MarR family winged helix-turn-helix transcriptional regulator [Micropruina sp.]|uniref:MarR family winged helix-turn-helix transcriptional regulator n=1 Tax=Micropruina sp. TaxID=2737536 RepID=UPI0039E30578